MTVCMTTFLCPCPLSAQVFAAKNTFSYSGQLHARRMVSSLLRRLGPSPERGQVARWLLGPVLVRLTQLTRQLWWSLRLLAQSWADPSTSSKDKAKSKVNPYQSAFNKLLQFGSSVRATKTAGSYGERPDRTISMGINLQHAPGAVHPNGKGRKSSSLPLADRYNLMKSSLLIFAPLKDGAQKL